jgi:hypothetical protein
VRGKLRGIPAAVGKGSPWFPPAAVTILSRAPPANSQVGTVFIWRGAGQCPNSVLFFCLCPARPLCGNGRCYRRIRFRRARAVRASNTGPRILRIISKAEPVSVRWALTDSPGTMLWAAAIVLVGSE